MSYIEKKNCFKLIFNVNLRRIGIVSAFIAWSKFAQSLQTKNKEDQYLAEVSGKTLDNFGENVLFFFIIYFVYKPRNVHFQIIHILAFKNCLTQIWHVCKIIYITSYDTFIHLWVLSTRWRFYFFHWSYFCMYHVNLQVVKIPWSFLIAV